MQSPWIKAPTVVVVLLAIALWGCKKDTEPFDELEPYRGHWLLPLVQSDVSLVQLSQLQVIPLEAEVQSLDFDYPAGVYPAVPPFSLPAIGPYPIAVAEFLDVMEIASADVSVHLENPFPLTISSGTRLVLRNAPNINDPGNIVLDIAIQPDLAPSSAFDHNGIVSDVDVTDTLYLYLQDFHTPGGSNLVFDGSTAHISIDLSHVQVQRLAVDTNIEFQRTDSVELSIDSELADDTAVATGHIYIYADNGLPVNAFFQCYLYDAGGVLIDSLFNDPFAIEGGQTDLSGATLVTTTSVDTIAVTPARLGTFLRSAKAELAYGVNTMGHPGPVVAANAAASLRIQLVGDLRLNIAYSEFE